jgi:hypothetical protein
MFTSHDKVLCLLAFFINFSNEIEMNEKEIKLLSNNNSINDYETEKINEENVGYGEFDYTNNIAVKYIWPTFPIAFLILGTIANILSIIVFTRREMRKFSSFFYFAVLNAVNLAVLYVTLIRVIMDYNFKTDVRRLNLFTCKLHVFLTYFLGHLSSLLLCTISIDRVISVMFLKKAKEFCTPRTALYVTIGLITFNFFLSSHFLIFESGYINNISEEENMLPNYNNQSMNNSRYEIRQEVVCETRNGTIYNDLVQNLWKIIDMSIYAFIPFIIMLICSVIIIFRVAQQSKKFENKKKKTANKSEKKISGQTIATQSNQSRSNDDKFSSRTRNLALMLIPVNVLFLMFLAPVVITIYIYHRLSEDQLTLAIVELLSYCNFTLNFFIYFLTSSKFREEFFKFFGELFAISKSTNYNTNIGTIRQRNLVEKNNLNEVIPMLNKKEQNHA